MTNRDVADKAYLRARRLRRSTTDAEKRLWRELRKLELKGSHFRRQVPIGPFIADFACMAARVLIEVDGSQHGEEQNRLRDDARTRWLIKEGYCVLRFWNNQINKNIDGVMEAIYAAIYGSSSAPVVPLKHLRRRRPGARDFPTPARISDTRRPSPFRGG